MFLHLSVILFTGNVSFAESLCPGGGICPVGLCPEGSLSRGISVQWGLCPEGSLSNGSLCSLSSPVSVQGVSVQEGVSVQVVSIQGDPAIWLYGTEQVVCILLECILVDKI